MSQLADNVNANTAVSAEDVRQRIGLLRAWLVRRLSAERQSWVDQQIALIAKAQAGTVLAVAIGLAARRLGKDRLQLDDAEIAAAVEMRPGLDAADWSVDQAARILFILASFEGAEDTFAARLDAFLRSAEFGEQIALYRGLPLYPAPEGLLPIAGEGIRSAMQPVFEAVAHNSPYPAEQFTESMWNQMVVKALFVGSRLAPIHGLDQRRNADLARMLVDYAHERWAAQRSVSPELWRCVGPFAGEDYFPDLLKVFRSATGEERTAAALALSECPTPNALIVLESAPSLWRDIRNGRLTWDTLEFSISK